NYAQGGIAGVLDPEDQFESHIEDTIEAGKGLCERQVVELVVREAPERIAELAKWGTNFDRHGDKLALTREGGHSFARVVHALGDATGREVMRAVIERARRAANLQIWEQVFTIDLLTDDNRCHGALVWQPTRSRGGEESGNKTLVWAKQTILSTGGAGQLYRETTNPPIATGDGLAMGYRAGAELRDLEFMQFHPTVLYIAGSARHLITEAVRGEGAYLRDRTGRRFMPDYDSRAELASRDVVARAIAEQMAKTQHPNVYLDLTHLDAAGVRSRFPGIDRVCRQFGLDITRDLIPVRPGAHYMIGGLTVDLDGRTTLDGLWACGEVTSSGLHGANRLGSNSLLEALVYGVRCGAGAAAAAARVQDAFAALPIANPPRPARREEYNLIDLRNALSSLMWRHAGIERDAAGLAEAAEAIDFWCRFALEAEFDAPPGWQLQNMLTIASLMASSARQREETRGVHLRRDFPETDDEHWRRHITVRRPQSEG
ncbi:MAG: L-aspartate oxidase, partial [Planctomycetes bacterium]|nr:L-aspartate oxidase [Planctomycetota bacterium]